MTPPTSETKGVKRRDFLKVLGAAGAASASIGCGQEQVEALIPYLVSPDQTVPGVSTHYATLCRECSAGCGVVAEVRDGRAIKLEGNPEHPVNRGALCARGQAALQGLYNPDRYRGPMVRQNGQLTAATWDNALTLVRQRLAGQSGSAVRFLSQHEAGSFGLFVDQWMSGLGYGTHYAVDAEADLAVQAANQAEYGAVWPALDFGAARLIVSIGADFLDGWGASVPQQLSFAAARAKLTDAPRFVYIGARRSLTGLNADEWIACRPGSEHAIATALLGASGGASGTTLAQAAEASGLTEAQLQRLAEELSATRPSLVLAGASTPDASLVAQAVARINRALGNVGTTVKPAEAILSFGPTVGARELEALAREMEAGQVQVLLIRGANPVYTLPKATRFAEALARVPFKVSFSSYPDETSELCDVVLPDHHALESWGIAEPARGVLALQQPVMEPVFDTRPTGDVLLELARDGTPAAPGRFPWMTYREWMTTRFPGGAAGLTQALANGLGQGTLPTRSGAPAPAPGTQAPTPLAGDGDFFLVVQPSPVLGAGAGANKPWLQELPDPVSKICWQSWVELHPSVAERLGVHNGDHVTITTAAGSLTAPAWIYLGVRPDTVAVSLGQGHTAYGRYAQGIGVNAVDALGAVWNGAGQLALTQARARVAKAEGHSPLVSTEGSARQHGRGIARALTAAQLAAGVPGEVHHEFPGGPPTEFEPGLRSPAANDAVGELSRTDPRALGMYDPEHWSQMTARRWAMTIDLARCTGCSACVTACYAENNIPTVGARWQGRSLRPFHSADGSGWDTRPGANILKGREMSWLRIERYFEGGEDGESDFETRFLPMLCQHCGNAPCEPVCPVFATYHSPDGLNVQVYNRCVGTRYCSNGCPYKVRYFNWHGYGEPARRQYAFPEPLHLQLNPDVTVRGKGVMEKCTFCVQRIREAENVARLENRALQPDEFTTACAQACPSRAIVFGDAADPNWTVAHQVEDQRAYHVFEELNTFTAVVYLQKVNHPATGGTR
ncbi:MAG TPA: molybdopterin-dependent oxidoreductase [Gemmatimonadaceae bacterium]|nr:molybdopterin-dependent oxidoreductase [Gemmatimonadaceae bacterium]